MNSGLNGGNRIAYLDGLRGLAILAVLGFHYFSRFADGETLVYPYGTVLADLPLLEFGYYGVQLFFSISGFVIGLTLQRCRNPLEFAARRFARLWPTMLFCSVLTYAVLVIWPAYWPQSPVNFLPSLTFLEPTYWNLLIPGMDARWIDGAYWSLYVEVSFYFLAATIYFSNRQRFVERFTSISTLLVVSLVVNRLSGASHLANVFVPLTIVIKNLPWFMIGIAALLRYEGRKRASWMVLSIAGMLLVLLVLSGETIMQLPVGVLVAMLVLVPMEVAYPALLLGHRWLAGIGVASYSLYLLHQNAGLTLIGASADRWGLTGGAAFVLPVVIGGLLVGVSQLTFRYWETPLNRKIVSTFLAARERRVSSTT